MDRQARSSDQKAIVPACSIEENEGVVTLMLEMPGVSKDGLAVDVESNTLTIVGRRGESGSKGTWLMRERREGNYRKVFTLDETIDHDRIEAETADGMLILKLHVRESAKPRRIVIG